jgi:hypothetical protein
VNDTRNIYAYDDGQNLIEEIQTVWQTGSESWIEGTKISYTLDQEDQVVEKLYQAWITGEWKNTTLYTYQYFSPGKESEYVYHIWDTDAWKVISRQLKEYDETGILVLETDQQWQDGDQSWLNDYQWEYFYTHSMDSLMAYISDSTNISCHGFYDGTATVTITGGVPPYNIQWNDPLNSTTQIVFGLSANRYYTVTVTDALLNTVVDSVILSEPDEIITGPIYGESTVDLNDTVTYWVESDPVANYSWFVMNGQILSSQAGDSVVIIWIQPGQGKVSVIESNSFGCEGDTVHLFVSVSPTAIKPPQAPSMQVYPNPASQFVIIQFSEKILHPWDLDIYDMTGKTIRSLRSMNENRYQISLDEFTRGIYFFKISGLSEIKIQKVIIEK